MRTFRISFVGAFCVSVAACGGSGETEQSPEGTGADPACTSNCAGTGGSTACEGTSCPASTGGTSAGTGAASSTGGAEQTGTGGAGNADAPMGPGDYQNDCEVVGDFRVWHKVSVVCDGPMAAENDATFTDHRMIVSLTNGEETMPVPGHFAADGDAGNSGSSSGFKWRAHFMPPAEGKWSYSVSFRKGSNVAVSDDAMEGAPIEGIDGAAGAFDVAASDKTGRDMRAHGLLEHLAGGRYLRHRGTGQVYVEGGVDSPENLFGYDEFDNTTKMSNVGSCKGILHSFDAHDDDWNVGDPTWGDSRGKSLIGLLNYLASTGVNAIYLVPMSENGDGCDAHPWSEYGGDHRAFDVSKLEQWETVFTHMTAKGFLIHFVTQETENDQLLNNGNLGLERKLYYREMISRFGHHPALQWNLGEENTNTAAQERAFATYIKAQDPYDHAVFMHTYPGEHDRYDDLLGFGDFNGPTLQYGGIPESTNGGLYGETRDWIADSTTAGNPWVVTATEASGGDAPTPHTAVTSRQRIYWMYANAMAGGGGFEWYLKNDGAGHAYDLAVEDLREFDAHWQQSGHFVRFFNEIVPADGADLQDFNIDNDATSSNSDWVLSNGENQFIVFLREGGGTSLDATGGGDLRVTWFNPRTGETTHGEAISAAANQSLGMPPSQANQDWLAWVRP